MDLSNGSGNPLPFLKCANGTLLPLTLRGPSATMPLGKIFTTVCEGRNRSMAGGIVMPPIREEGNRASLPMGFVRGLLDTVEKPLILAQGSDHLLLVNPPGKHFFEFTYPPPNYTLKLFNNFLSP